MLNSDWLEEGLDGELIVRFASDALADQRRMGQRVSRIAAAGSRIKSQLRRSDIAAVAENVFPGAIIRSARRFRTNAGGMVEQLLDRDLVFAWIAKRLGPRNKLKGRIVESHLFGRRSVLALLGRNRQHRGADGLRH